MTLIEIAIVSISFSMSIFALIASLYNGNDLRDLERKVDRLENEIENLEYKQRSHNK